MPHHRPKYKDYWWDDLSEEARKAAGVLGWDTKEKWDNSVDVPFRESKTFVELTQLEKQAAIFLQIELLEKYLDFYWSEADPEIKKAALAIGWDQHKWDHDWKLKHLEIDHKYWKELTETEKAGAMYFGYTQHTWDEDMVEVFEMEVQEPAAALPELPAEELEKEEEESDEEVSEEHVEHVILSDAVVVPDVEEDAPAAEPAPAAEEAAPAAASTTAADSTTKVKKFKVSGQYGGSGGEVFDHKNHRRIQKLTVFSGRRFVDSIEAVYENRKTMKSGGDGGDAHTLEMGTDEWIVLVEVRHSDDGVQCLTFTTNSGKTLGPCGGSGGLMGKSGVQTKLKAPPNMKLVGFKGRKGNRLDAIAMRWGPAKA